MGDEYVDGPIHDQKGEKTIKNNNDLKNYGGITILNNDLCQLHKHGWVFLFFISLYSFYHSHLSYIESSSP